LRAREGRQRDRTTQSRGLGSRESAGRFEGHERLVGLILRQDDLDGAGQELDAIELSIPIADRLRIDALPTRDQALKWWTLVLGAVDVGVAWRVEKRPAAGALDFAAPSRSRHCSATIEVSRARDAGAPHRAFGANGARERVARHKERTGLII
jgi:hypothetical protein